MKRILYQLNATPKKHLRYCKECRSKWQEFIKELTIINSPFDPDKEPLIDITSKPPSGKWLTSRLLEQLRTAKMHQKEPGFYRCKKASGKMPANNKVKL